MEITPARNCRAAPAECLLLDEAKVKLRTGMLMNVRYTLRRQRLVTLVLDPLRRWFR